MANDKKFDVKNGLYAQNVEFHSPNQANAIIASMSNSSNVLTIAGNVDITKNLTVDQTLVVEQGIQNTVIGNVTPSSAQFTTISVSSNATVNGLNVNGSSTIGSTLGVTGNVTAPNFIGNVIGNIAGNITAAGANTQVLFNDNNVTGASDQFTFNKASNLLSIGGNISTAGVSSTGSGTFNSTLRVSGGIQNTPIGNTTASTGQFTTISATGNITGAALTANGSITSGTTLSAAGGIQSTPIGNVTASSGQFTTISATGNITGAALTANGSITSGTTLQAQGGIQNTPIGNVTPSSGLFTSIGSSGNATVNALTVNATTTIGSTLGVTGNTIVGNLRTSGTVLITNTTNSTGANTGALIVQGGASFEKDVHVLGNIFATNVIAINANTLSVQDPLLYLTANTPFPYNYDIGIYSQFTGGPGNIYQHTGFVRDVDDGIWKLFSNVVPEPTITIDFTNAVYDRLQTGGLTSLGSILGNSSLSIFGNATVGNLTINASGVFGSTLQALGGIQNTPIGNVTASTGQFTTVSATGNIIGSALTANSSITAGTTLSALGGIQNTPIGNGTASTGTFTTLTTTGNLTIADAIIHSNDTDTFIRFTANDVFAVTTSGSERYRITPNGNVLINTLTDNESRLSIAQNSSTDRYAFYSSGTYVSSGPSGNVFGAYINAGVSNNSGNVFGIYSTLAGTASATSYVAYLLNPGNATKWSYGLYSEVTQPDLNGPGRAFGGYFRVNSGSSGVLGRTYGVYVENTANTGGLAYGAYIETTNSNATTTIPLSVNHASTELIRVLHTGNVGIRTSNPTSTLEVNGTFRANAGIQNTPIGNTTASTGQFTTVSATGNITGAALTSNGSITAITSLSALGGLQNTPIGNVTASTGQFTTVSATGNITGAALTANGSITAQTSLSALGGLQNTPIGNITASSGQFTTVSATGNVTAAAVTANGSLTTGTTLQALGGIQNTPIGNVTPSTAIFTSASVSGNATVNQLTVNSTATIGGTLGITGNVTGGSYISSTNHLIVNSNQSEGGQIVLAWPNITGLTTQANSTWNMDVDGTPDFRIFYQNAIGGTGVLFSANSLNNLISFPGSGGVTATGNVTAPNFIGNFVGNISGNIAAAGSNTQILFNDNNQVGASSQFTFNKTSNLLTVGGNVNANGLAVNGSGTFTSTVRASGGLQNTPIGNGTASSGAFTTLTADTVAATNNGNGTNFRVGDDVWIGDINVANTLRLTGLQDGTQAYIVFGNSNSLSLGRNGTGALTYQGAFTAQGGITNTPIGNGTASTGQFTTVSATGNITGAALTANGSITAQTSLSALGGIQNTPIGNGTASTGQFTTVSATGNVTGAALTANGSLTTGTTLQALGGIQNTPIGNGTASTGQFTTVSATGNITGAAVTANGSITSGTTLSAAGGLQNTPIGNGTASTGQFTTISATGNITGSALTANGSLTTGTTLQALGGIQNTPIGNVTASTGQFTTVSATGNITGAALTANGSVTAGTTLSALAGLQNTPIGNVTASTGAFTTVTTTGNLTIADAIVHASDADTFIRFPANDTFSVTTNGSDRIYVDSTGNVGFGTTSPNAKVIIVDTVLANSGNLVGSALTINQNWNTTGNVTAIKLNVTNVASGSNSLLMDLQIGGSSIVSINKNGLIYGTSGAGIGWAPNAVRLVAGNGNSLYINRSGTASFSELATFYDAGVSTSYLNLYSLAEYRIGGDTILARDSGNVFAQRNGLGAQAFRIYNTYTDASNFERANIGWAGNILSIGAEAAGSGTARMTRFISNVSGTATSWEFRSNSSQSPRLTLAGTDRSVILAAQPNMLNIVGGGLWSTLDYSAGASTTHALLSSNGNQTISYFGLAGSAANVMQLNTGAGKGDGFGAALELWEMTAPNVTTANGIRVYAEDGGSSNAQLSFLYSGSETFKFIQNGTIRFGNTTSSAPALKRNGAALEVRLADDSGFANLTAGNLLVDRSIIANSSITILGGIQNTPIGNATASTGQFTTISATGNITGAALTANGSITSGTTLSAAGGIQNTPIGNVTPNSGKFTTLETTGAATVSSLTANAASVFYSNVTITGNLLVAGNVITTGSNNVAFTDSIIELHTLANLANLTFNDGKDIGIRFHYFLTENQNAFLGWDNQTGFLEWFGSNVDEQANANIHGTAIYGTIKSGEFVANNSTVATSSITGAIRTNGGLGVVGNIFAGGLIDADGGLQATPIGNLTPSTALFTSVVSSGNATVNALTVNATATIGSSLGVTGNINGTGLTLSGSMVSTGPAQHIGGLQATPIGNAGASTGQFTTLSATGNITGAAVTSNGSITAITSLSALGGIQNTIIGNVTPSSATFTSESVSGNSTVNALTVNASATIGTSLRAAGGIQNTPIGNVTASTGQFTTVSATGNVTGTALTANGSITAGTTLQAVAGVQNTPIGNVTASSGAFTTLNATGNVTIADAIIHDNDTNTFFRFLANDTIVITTNGSEAIRVDSSGNVGINVNVPTYKLHVSGSFAATTKSFVIPHPTKPDYTLVYGSLEGPENGVYVRGKLTGHNVIQLPDYWVDLVDENTITVQLTSIGKYQKLYVESVENNQVKINYSGIMKQSINCYYTVFAERKDVGKLQVEVKH